MNVESIHQTFSRLYRNGTIVIWKQDIRGRDTESLTQIARHPRSYSISRTKIQSACIAAWVAKQSKFMLFITFTFPFDPTEKQASKIWDLTLNSLRNTYKIKSYVWVKEKQYKNLDRLHYHCIIDRNRVDICKLQESYNS